MNYLQYDIRWRVAERNEKGCEGKSSQMINQIICLKKVVNGRQMMIYHHCSIPSNTNAQKYSHTRIPHQQSIAKMFGLSFSYVTIQRNTFTCNSDIHLCKIFNSHFTMPLLLENIKGGIFVILWTLKWYCLTLHCFNESKVNK